MPGLFFDDIKIGQVFETAANQVGRSEVLEFASAFDPNPFHLDDGAARSAGLDGIIASGFHTLSLSFRLFFELHLWDDAILPSPGLNMVRWCRPLYPGDKFWVRATVTGAVRSTSKPGLGVVHMLHETVLASSEKVILTVEAMHRLKLRSA